MCTFFSIYKVTPFPLGGKIGQLRKRKRVLCCLIYIRYRITVIYSWIPVVWIWIPLFVLI